MTEAEIVFQLSELYDRYWTILQWWAGTSFIVIGVCHVASARLTKVTLGLILVLYSFFSAWLYNFNFSNVVAVFGFIEDLSRMSEAGEIQTAGAQGYLDGFQQNIGVLTDIVLFGTFTCTLGFAIYSFREAKKN